MRAQRRGELFPLAHQAGQLLYGLVALERDGAYTVAIGIEARVAERAPDLLDPALETVDPALDLRDARFQRPHLGGRRSSHDPRDGRRRGCTCVTSVAMRLMKWRSWEMKTIVPGNAPSASSRTSREARSRWFVGSSRQSSAAGRTSIFPSARRAFSPPESTATFLSTAS